MTRTRFVEKTGAMAAVMLARLMDNVQDGVGAAEGQFQLGSHEVCVSIDPTGCDVTVYDECGMAECLPNVKEAVRRAMPTYTDAAHAVALEADDTLAELSTRRDICRCYGWSCPW